MVKRRIDPDGSDGYYDELQESWPDERPSRKRQRRTYRRRQERQVVVEPKRLHRPSTGRISRALLAAQRELAEAQAEEEAQSKQPPGGERVMAARPDLVFARLYPPRPLAASAVEAFLLRLASDTTHATVAFEAHSRPVEHGTGNQVSYGFGTPAQHLRWLRRTLYDHLSGTILQAEPSGGRASVEAAAHLQIQPRLLALATDRPEAISLAVLSALNQRLERGEELVVQVVLGARRSPSHRRGRPVDPSIPWWQVAIAGTSDAPTGMLKQHDARIQSAGMATCIRLGVTASTPERRQRLLVGLLGGLSTAKAPGTFLGLRRESTRRLDEARPPRRWDIAPAASELVGLLAWPLGDADLPVCRHCTLANYRRPSRCEPQRRTSGLSG